MAHFQSHRSHVIRPASGRRLVVALFVVATLVAAACGDDDNSDDGAATDDTTTGTDNDGSVEPGDADAGLTEALGLPECPVGAHLDANGKVAVTVWHAYGTLAEEALEDMATLFNESQDKIEVTVRAQGGYGELYRLYKDSIATEDLPTIAILDDTTFREVVDSQTVLPAQSCIEADSYDMSDFVPIVKTRYSADGALYPGSFASNALLLYYNKDHFREAGLDPENPPGTLAEVREAADAIKAAGLAPEGPWVVKTDGWLVENMRVGVGAELVSNENGRGDSDETPTAAFNDETTLELLTLLKEMNDEGTLNPVPATEGQINHYLAVGSGNSSMLIETSTAATTIAGILSGEGINLSELAEEGNVDVADIELDIDVGVAPLPGLEEPGRYQLGGGAWYMTNEGEDAEKAAAWEFIKFVNEVPQQRLSHLKGSFLPVRESVIADPDVQFAWENNVAGQWLKVAFDQFNALDPSFPGPVIGPYQEAREALKVMLEEVIFESADPQAAIDRAEAKVNDYLATYEDQNF